MDIDLEPTGKRQRNEQKLHWIDNRNWIDIMKVMQVNVLKLNEAWQQKTERRKNADTWQQKKINGISLALRAQK